MNQNINKINRWSNFSRDIQEKEGFGNQIKQSVRSNIRKGRKTLANPVNKVKKHGSIMLRKMGFM